MKYRLTGKNYSSLHTEKFLNEQEAYRAGLDWNEPPTPEEIAQARWEMEQWRSLKEWTREYISGISASSG